MRKVRVYQLARELKVTNKQVLELLGQLGVEVGSHAAAVDSTVAEQVRTQLAGPIRKHRDAAVAAAPEGSAAPEARAVSEPVKEAAPPARPAEQDLLPSLSLATLPRAGDFEMPTLSAAVDSAAAPPARHIGPAVPTRQAVRTMPKRGRDRPDRPTRTYRPDRPYTPGGPGGRGGPGGSGGPPGGGGPRRGGEVGERRGKRGKRKKKRREVDEREMLDSVRRTMATLDSSRTRKRKRVRGEDGVEIEEEVTKVDVSEYVTAAELASALGVKPNEVVVTCMRLGVLANINRRLDKDTIEAVADELGFEVEFVKEFGDEMIEEVEEQVKEAPEVPRPPIVTVMGHVDHGKTKLLDFVRKTDVVAGESGGITQHIGAYQAHVGDKLVTFLDTPGHLAFTQMRARGADVTDIVVLIVAADDRVNEQTIEAINHAKAARKPIIVAINKCDLPAAEPEKIKQQLSEQGLLVEDWGGEVVAVEISAKFGQNVDKLLEMILLVADLGELTAQADRPAKGTIIEARKDPGRGVVATVLLQHGTLKVGDPFVCGNVHGSVRAMKNDRLQDMESAGPASAVELLGWSDVPQVGDSFTVVKDNATARVIAGERSQIAREHRMRLAGSRFRLDELHTRIKEQEQTFLRLIIRADVQGSVEVLRDSLEKLSGENVVVDIVATGVGRINESDVLLAATSNAIIIGFHVRPDPKATQLAQTEGVQVRLYKVIYEAIDEIKKAMSGLLKPIEEERVLGSAEVREIFAVTKAGAVAGCHVVAGLVSRKARTRVIRNEDVIWEGQVGSLKRFKEDVREVQAGYDCGMVLDGFTELKVGDQIEAFVIEEVAQTQL